MKNIDTEGSTSPAGTNLASSTSIPNSVRFDERQDNDQLGFVPCPVAICGIAVRLPGGIRDANTFWKFLVSGKDARAPIPPDRYNAKGFDNSLGNREVIESQWGYFLDEDLSVLDTSFFSYSKEELAKADPQQRQLLMVARECLEDAGEAAYRGKSIGCYVGTFGEEWQRMNIRDTQQPPHHAMTGYSDTMLANRISYEYDLKGPSIVIKTGCSASLVALHQACRALQTGDCCAALVAGSSLLLTPGLTSTMMVDGILSPNGSCKTFDAKADGFARAEGINAVYVKLLDDAIRDGNPIRAVIRNTAVNSGGKSASLTAPNEVAHEQLMRKAYSGCRLDPKDTPYVECHGTGTQTGDRVETTAVGRVFGERNVFIGSVKPNVGHSEAASGLTSLIKAVLALENNTIPPNINFHEPNPSIGFRQYNLTVPMEPIPWPAGRLHRISVNSYGIGGSNAHAIVESPGKRLVARRSAEKLLKPTPSLLLCTANTAKSLQMQVSMLTDYLRQNPDNLYDAAFTLALHREHLTHRAYLIADNALTIDIAAPAKIALTPLNLVMVFSGQGAQWPRMGVSLMDSDQEFLSDIRRMDQSIQTAAFPPEWTIESELRKAPSESNLRRAELAQPLCTAVQIALFNAFTRAGVRPVAVVGHSSGEIAAAFATGMLSQRAAILTAYYRGQIMISQTKNGAMAAINLASKDLGRFLCPGAVVACENSPTSTTISGDRNAVEKTLAKIKSALPQSLAKLLNVDQAYHSPHMEKVATRYELLLCQEFAEEHPQLQSPIAEFYSTVEGQKIHLPIHHLDVKYWSSNLLSPVRFASAVSSIIHDLPEPLFLEIGPHSTMSSPLRQICSSQNADFLYISSMQRDGDCKKNLLSAFGQLFQKGISIQFENIIHPGRALSNLPTYPWDLTSGYWNESRLSKDWRTRQFGHHELLGTRVPESTDIEPAWRNVLSLADNDWLGDHKVHSDIVFPFAGFCAMAGEALRQLTSTHIGYRLRNVSARKILVIKNSESIEIITTLRSQNQDSGPKSDHWVFTICSYSGSAFLKHCEGLVEVQKNHEPSSLDMSPLFRKIDTTKWYDTFRAAGQVYGPRFRGMESISSSTNMEQAQAKANVRVTIDDQEKHIFLHATTIDTCIQVALVALARGVGRNLVRPTFIVRVEELDVSTYSESLLAQANNSINPHSFDIKCGSENRLALRASGLEFQAANEDLLAMDLNLHAAARLHWRPLIGFVDHEQLFKPGPSRNVDKMLLEKVVSMCMIDSAEKVRNLSIPEGHLRKYREWLNTEIQDQELAKNPMLGNEATSIIQLTKEDRRDLIKTGLEQLCNKAESRPYATAIQRIWENIESICSGTKQTLDVLVQDDALAELYQVMSFDYSEFIQLFAHANPNSRIIEVGAGTGATTYALLQDLIDDQGTPLYTEYVFTDISSGFLSSAKSRFAHAPNMDYKIFDISEDPLAQGLEARSFDLIVATNVVHATPVLKATLTNLKVLLKPTGRLILTEVTCVSNLPNFIYGAFSGWWLGADDGRKTQPYITADQWDIRLKEAGFTGAETTVYDAEQPFQHCVVIVSQPAKDPTPHTMSKQVTLLSNKPHIDPVRGIIRSLQDAGLELNVHGIGQDLPESQDIVSVLDYEGFGLGSLSEGDFSNLQRLISRHQSDRIFWLTRPAQIGCQAPDATMAVGLARSARCELGVQFVTFEIEPSEPAFASSVLKIIRYVTSRQDTEALEPDWEFAFHDGFIKVGRYLPCSLTEELSRIHVDEPGMSKMLQFETTGVLNTVKWTEALTKGIREVNEVEIQTLAIGLSRSDIERAWVKGRVANKRNVFDMDVVGMVTAVGPGVREFAVGDVVMALATNGCVSTNTVINATLAVKVPRSLDIQAAATMPFSFVTAMYALHGKGGLRSDLSVLIHSAASDVGQAATQICKMAGSRILVTATGKRECLFLIHGLGLAEDCVFDLENDRVVQDVVRATNGQGVDIVLNAAYDTCLYKLWKCVNKFGVLIDTRPYDRVDLNSLIMTGSSRNKAYHSVDMPELIRERPNEIKKYLAQTVDGYLQGHLSPFKDIHSIGPNQVAQPFKSDQSPTTSGRFTIEMPANSEDIEAAKMKKAVQLDPEGSYLLTGGLGGLGQALALWMVERGARSLLFLSPGAGETKGRASFLTELESMGCSISVQRGRVEVMEDVTRALAATAKPVRGIVHLAVVLRDGPIGTMPYADWDSVIKPKAQGAWNLHNASQSLKYKLDFFILGSTLFSILEQPGQCNYYVGNLFLEGLCQYRRQQGLVASVINIAAMDEIGLLSRSEELRRRAKTAGVPLLREQQLLDAFELAMMLPAPAMPAQFHSTTDAPCRPWHSEGQIIIGLRAVTSLDCPSNKIPWRRNRRLAVYHNLHRAARSDGTTTTSESSEIATFLASVGNNAAVLKESASADVLGQAIGHKISELMLRSTEEYSLDTAVAEVGLDSLVAIELRRWWKQAFGLKISTLEIMSAGTLRRLGKVAADGLAARIEGENQ